MTYKEVRLFHIFFMGPFIRKAMQCNAFNEVRLCIGIYAMHGGVYEGKWCPFDLKSMPFTK